MRIVHVANFYGPRSGGLRTTMHALGSGYRAAGHDSVLVVPGPAYREESTTHGRRITVPGRVVPGMGGYRVITDLKALRALLERLGPDRLEVSDRSTLRGLGGWAAQRGVPALMWAHERLDGVLGSTVLPTAHGNRAATAVADRLNRASAAAFDRVLCTTGFAAAEFARIGATNVERVALGVDLDAFSRSHRDAALRGRLARPDEVLLVLCSRLSPEKRPELAVEALAALRRAGVAARLVVAGTGPRERSLRAGSAGLPVHLLGFLGDRAEVAALLATADAVIAPGPIETFGLAALEALASGTSVVASRTSALAEVIGGEVGAGAVADPTGPALADAVLRVLAVPEQRRRAAARRRAEGFPWSATVAAMLDLHTSLAPVPTESRSGLPRARTAALVRASYARTLAGTDSGGSAGRGPRLCALGDSVTLGVGDLVEPGQRPGWAAHVATALDSAAFLNFSTLGARAATVADEQLERALAHRPDLVLVSAGGNDVLRGDLDGATVAEATRRYVHALQASGATVVISRLPDGDHISWLPSRLRRVLKHRVGIVNLALESVSRSAGVPLTSITAGRASQSAAGAAGALWHVDRIHPGPLGHRRLAEHAVVTLAERGFDQVAAVPSVTAAPPGAASQMGWLLRNGAPWLVKRSVDLAPALGRQMLSA